MNICLLSQVMFVIGEYMRPCNNRTKDERKKQQNFKQTHFSQLQGFRGRNTIYYERDLFIAWHSSGLQNTTTNNDY